jgi:methylated-DNA-[protein]-cysteine S-methyltransferase
MPTSADSALHALFPSPFGTFAIVWQESNGDALIRRIFLAHPLRPAAELVGAAFPFSRPSLSPAIAARAARLQQFMAGDDVQLPLAWVNLSRCSPFQRRVLLEEKRIPRSRVDTYGNLARKLSTPTAARAVARALATNPFPLIIPCHRTVRALGNLAGFQGGMAMKRILLEQEGVAFTASGRVDMCAARMKPSPAARPRRHC